MNEKDEKELRKREEKSPEEKSVLLWKMILLAKSYEKVFAREKV